MADEDNGFPPAWRPQPGDTIHGKVQSVTLGPDLGYGTYPIVTLVAEGGSEMAIHAFHTVLRTQLAQARPQAGDSLTVLYHGKRSPKGGTGNDYHSYRVSGGQEREFNWDSESGDGVPIAPAPAPMSKEQLDALRGAQAAEKTRETQDAAAENFGNKVPF
jgi:hypothetical protein